MILHDNAYSDIIYTRKQGTSFYLEGARRSRSRILFLTKSYNLTGARISFVVGNREIIEKFRTLRSQIDYGIFLPIQYAAIAALTGPDDFIEEQRRSMRQETVHYVAVSERLDGMCRTARERCSYGRRSRRDMNLQPISVSD